MLSGKCHTQRFHTMWFQLYDLLAKRSFFLEAGEGGTSLISRKRRRPHHFPWNLLSRNWTLWFHLVSHKPALFHNCQTWLQGEQYGLFEVVDVQPKVKRSLLWKKGRINTRDNQQTMTVSYQQGIWGTWLPKTLLLLQAFSQKLIICKDRHRDLGAVSFSWRVESMVYFREDLKKKIGLVKW